MQRVFQYRMPAGFVGSVSRVHDATIVPALLDLSAPPTGFGEPVVLGGNEKIQGVTSATVDADIYGFLVRPYPIQNDGTGSIGTTEPYTINIGDVLRRGWIVAQLRGDADAIKGKQAYVRIANGTTDQPVGGIEAAADNTVTATAKGGNTGNGTVGTLEATGSAKPGDYLVTFTAATAFTVSDPDGNELAAGTTGTAYSAAGISFTITAGGTAFAAGDGFTISHVQNVAPIPNAQFNGGAAAGGEVEIAYNI